MKVLLLDNYDSFTYNLVHYLEQLEGSVTVWRNDDPRWEEFIENPSGFDALVLSPGPGLPSESGRLMEVIAASLGKLPVLGVCLGMQALAEHAGATLYNRDGVMHGRTALLEVNEHSSVLLEGVKSLEVGLYHSWAVRAEGLPKAWKVCATALADCAPMVMENNELGVYAVQFHPESILTPEGLKMLQNWLRAAQNWRGDFR